MTVWVLTCESGHGGPIYGVFETAGLAMAWVPTATAPWVKVTDEHFSQETATYRWDLRAFEIHRL